MMHTCRFPGCTERLQTLHGREVHEKMCHGLADTWMLEEVFGKSQDQESLLEVDVPYNQQLAFDQDLIVISEAIESRRNTCCC